MSLSPSSSESSCSSRSSITALIRDSSKPKTCVMCSRKVRGMHYGVASCISCKTFFRRSLLSDNEIHCRKKKECSEPPEFWSNPVNAQSFGQCAWCRLNRFVRPGMNPRAVLPGCSKDLRDFPNAVKLLTSSSPNRGIAQTNSSAPIANLDFFLSVRLCDIKHRQLRISDFNLSREKQFEWRLEDYMRQPVEMEMNTRSTFGMQHALKKNWKYVDIVCAIEYVMYFVATFAPNLAISDQITILRNSVIQLSILEIHHYSCSAGFRDVSNPDGEIYSAHSHSDILQSKVSTIALTSSELSMVKALLVCKSNGVSPHGQSTLEELRSKSIKVLARLTICDNRPVAENKRFTSLYALEFQRSVEVQNHVIEYLNKPEPRVKREIYF